MKFDPPHRSALAMLVSCTLLGLASPPLLALDGDVFSLNGFGTVGVTRASSREAGFVRDLAQPRGRAGDWRADIDSLIGVQATWQLSDQLSLTGQAVSRFHDHSSYTPELTWAFARWEPNSTYTLRAGRLATDFYLYSDSRQVGYSYLPVRPSTDFFGVLPFSHLDGADAIISVPMGSGTLRSKFFAGWLNESLPLASQHWNLTGSRMLGASLTWQQGPWTVRASSSELRFQHNLPIDALTSGLRQTGNAQAINAADALDVAGTRSRFHSVGGIYDDGPLQAQLMISRVKHESAAFQDWWAGYALAGYRLGNVTPYAGYSWIRSRSKSLSTGLPNLGPFAALNAGVAGVLADSHSHQGTTSLGLRWDFRANMDIKVQYDMIRGQPDSIFPFRGETARWNGRTDVFSLVLDFIF